jgi:hypothetical protein
MKRYINSQSIELDFSAKGQKDDVHTVVFCGVSEKLAGKNDGVLCLMHMIRHLATLIVLIKIFHTKLRTYHELSSHKSHKHQITDTLISLPQKF